jgi:hypothetical protein
MKLTPSGRINLISAIWMLTFLGYLISINQYGSERRMAPLFLPFYFVFFNTLASNKGFSLGNWLQSKKGLFTILLSLLILFQFLFLSLFFSQAYILSFYTFSYSLWTLRLFSLFLLLLTVVAYYLIKDNKQPGILVMKALFAVHLILNIFFVSTSTHTLKDQIGRITTLCEENKLSVITGVSAHQFSIGPGQQLPVWWLNKEINHWNEHFFDTYKKPFLLIQEPGNPSNKYLDTFGLKQIYREPFDLYPVPFTTSFREHYEVYIVQNNSLNIE